MRRFRERNNYRYILIAMALVLVIITTGCGKGEVVAKVDGEAITKDQLYDQLVEQNGEQVLNSLISEKIIELELKKQKIKIGKEEVKEELEKLKEQHGGEEGLNMMIMQYGMDMEDLENNIAMNLKLKKLLGPEIDISEEEMLDYYEENKEAFGEAEQVKARHILVETEEEAKEISKELESGGDFAKLAKKHSLDEASKESGGDLGFFGKGEMVKEFEKSAFSLKPNEISDPVKTDHGYHIIEVLEKKEAKIPSYKDVKDDIEDILLQQKISMEYGSWYQKKLEEYKVENFLIDR
ncbi:MAG TPA: foldase [Tepidimicrobium sp.]|nr:foldase [Tepidimicrobium sp.]